MWFGLLLPEFDVAIGGGEGALEDCVVCFGEVDEGHAHSAPAAVDGFEDGGEFADEGLLLVEGEFEDSATFYLGRERGEDSIVTAEVGVAHVGAFDGSRERECVAAKVGDGGGHDGGLVAAGALPDKFIWSGVLYSPKSTCLKGLSGHLCFSNVGVRLSMELMRTLLM